MNGEPDATPWTSMVWTPVRPGGRRAVNDDLRLERAGGGVEGRRDGRRLPAVATEPPPAVANFWSTSPLASGALEGDDLGAHLARGSAR